MKRLLLCITCLGWLTNAHAGIMLINPGWKPGQEIRMQVLADGDQAFECFKQTTDFIQENINIKFNLIRSASTKRGTHIDVLVTLHSYLDASFSDLGRVPTGKNIMVISVFNPGLAAFPNQTFCSGTISHELGHLLGLQHEQNHPDRPVYIAPLFVNLVPEKSRVLDRRIDKDDKLYKITSYDLGSTMHYDADLTHSDALAFIRERGFKALPDDLKKFITVSESGELLVHKSGDPYLDVTVPLGLDLSEFSAEFEWKKFPNLQLQHLHGQFSPADIEILRSFYGLTDHKPLQ